MKFKKICLLIFIALFLTGCAANSSVSVTYEPAIHTDPEESTIPPVIETFNFSEADALYVRGYETMDELMEAAALIVRATPVSTEFESDFAVCLLLDVAESSIEGIETIHLRQVKDEYQLDIGEEVVLALEPDAGEGYYHIPGGGDGLFYETFGTPQGKLLSDLLENSPAPLSEGGSLTLEGVFDLLVNYE